MANDQNLKPAKKGEVRGPNGRPKGSPNRSTIAKRILAMRGVLPDAIRDELAARYPSLHKTLTIEEVMTIQQVEKAIMQKDTYAYNSVMDSAYGKPKQEVENTGETNTSVMVYYRTLPDGQKVRSGDKVIRTDVDPS